MKRRGLQVASIWGVALAGFVFGAALNAIAAAMVTSRLSINDASAIVVTIIAVPAGGVVCSGMARRWAERFFEGRE